MERTLQCLQAATWVSLKWSCGVLVIMTFFVVHAGQENWIAHPVLVPCISGFKEYCFFIGAFFLVIFFTIGATTKNRLVIGASVQKRFRRFWKGLFWCSVLMGADLLSKPFKMYTYMLPSRIERWEQKSPIFPFLQISGNLKRDRPSERA